MNLQDVLPYFDNKKSQLADALGVSRQAISRWDMDQPIPEKHALKLQHELLPNSMRNNAAQPADKKEITASKKLDSVCYEIRGPVLEEANRLEEDGRLVTKLNIGNPGAFDFHAPEEIIQDVILNLRHAEGYCDTRGLFPARKAVMHDCQLHGINGVNINDIYMGNGVSELIMLAMQALLNDGDQVLIPAPDYPLWTAATRLAGGQAVHYHCDEQSDWQPDIDDMRAKITDRTRAIVVINPNNPTGAVYSRDCLQAIADLASEHKLVLFADEIYSKILYDDAEHIPMGTLTDDTLVVSFGGLSKNYRLAGFRSGWMVLSGNKDIAGDYMEGLYMLASMRLCANVPGQLAVQTALGGYQSIRDLVLPKGRLREQRDTAWQMLHDIPGVSCVKPKGALYLFPKLDPKRFPIVDDEKFVLDLLKAKRLLLVQGSAFNLPTTDHLRLVFLPREEDLVTAIGKFGQFLTRYSGQ